MSIILFNAAYSTCSQKVRLCLAEKGLAFEERRLNLASKEHLTPEYLAMNPNGVVPTLVHDGAVITESSVILDYLDEVFPEPRLSPGDAVGRAHMRAFIHYLDEVPTAAVRVPSFNRVFRARFDGLDEQAFVSTHVEARTIRRQFYRRMGPGGFRRDDVEAALEQLGQAAARLDRALGAGPWLAGDRPTLADLVALPLFDRLEDLELDSLWADLPRVGDWLARMRARPSYGRAFYAGSRLSAMHSFRPLFVEETAAGPA